VSKIPFGAIVLTDFPFTDLTAAKRRPALVVSTPLIRLLDICAATALAGLICGVAPYGSYADSTRVFSLMVGSTVFLFNWIVLTIEPGILMTLLSSRY